MEPGKCALTLGAPTPEPSSLAVNEGRTNF